MNRLFVFAACVAVATVITACSLGKKPAANETTNQPAPSANKASTPKSETAPPAVQAGDLQPGQASGTYTAKGETVELKYSYAGRAERFGTQSMVILLTDTPIPPEALAEEIKSATLLEAEKIRGLEYVIDGRQTKRVRQRLIRCDCFRMFEALPISAAEDIHCNAELVAAQFGLARYLIRVDIDQFHDPITIGSTR